MRRLAFLVLAYLAVNVGAVVSAAEVGCHSTFYKTKDIACIDAFIKKLDKTPRAKINQVTPGAVGFFAGLFQTSPEMMDKVLPKSKKPITQRVFAMALFRSGHRKEAKEYVRSNFGKSYADSFIAFKFVEIDKIEPLLDGADNDRLVGAFMATGGLSYIHKIIARTENMDEARLHDVFRFAVLQLKFGANLTIQGRKEVGGHALCLKYACKKDPKDFLQLLVTSTGVWSVMSLSRQDEDIKQAFVSFLENHDNILKEYRFEKGHLSNYLTLLLLASAQIDHEPSENFLETYETFKSPAEVTRAFRATIEK